MQIEPLSVIGTWRRFGPIGPAYEVVSVGKEMPNGDRSVTIRLAETGEETHYTLSHLLGDEIIARNGR